MNEAEVLVRLAASKRPVAMSDVLVVPKFRDAFAPHLRGLTREESLDEVRHLLGAFREEAERKDAKRTTVTPLKGDLDDAQMALVVARLIIWPPPRNSPSAVNRNGVKGDHSGVTERRADAMTLTGFAGGRGHDNAQRFRRDSSLALLGEAFTREVVRWLGQLPVPAMVTLADLVAVSRIDLDEAPESFDELEEFVDSDAGVARLVAAGLHRQPDLSFARVVQDLRELTAEWDRPGVPGTPQTQAAIGWLSSCLDDDERFLLLVFASLPETVTLPLDLLAEEEGSGFSVEALAQLIAMGVVEEVAPERYRMPAELHRRLSPVVQKTHWSDGLDDLLESLVDYYEPRLQRVCAAIELHRLKDSVTDRIRAGYSASSRPPMSVEDAHAWWEAEQDNQIRLLDWMQPTPKNDDAMRRGRLALRLGKWGQRIVHAIGASSAAEFLTWLEHDRAQMHFTTHSARQAIREFDQLRLDSLRRMKDAIERGGDVPDEARIEEIESEIATLSARLTEVA